MLRVDPLAAFFRADLVGYAPLTLDATQVEITLLPPLAKIAVARHFTNSSDQLVEAVLTLPPVAQQEVVFRLIVTIGGVVCEAIARPSNRSKAAHDLAAADGRRAILHELLENDIQMISISGIKPGEKVEVQAWSVKPLRQYGENDATLVVALSAGHDEVMSVLTDADALLTTAARHPATLQLNWNALQVTLRGQGDPVKITSHDPVSIDCALPIQLEIMPDDGGSLDHCAWQVDQVGGWEVTSARGLETFRHPMNPGGSLTSNRGDWIFGVMATAQGEIRVTAPLSNEDIAPNARALSAFAAASLVESATPQAPDTVRHIANILSRETSLAFIGPEGEISDEMPVMRKLALPEMPAPDVMSAPPQPVALEPYDYGSSSSDPGPLLPRKTGDLITPGVRSTSGARQTRNRLLPWAIALVALLLIIGIFYLIDYPIPLRLVTILGLLLLGAIAFLPKEDVPCRRRLPFVTVLAFPWVAALGAGPLLHEFTYGGAPPPDWMIPTQCALLIGSAILPLVLMPFMPGARRFTFAIGILNFALTLFVTVSSILILSPGI